MVGGKPIRRVTSVIKARQRKKFGAAVDKATLDIWEEARATGDKIHLFNQDIVNKLTNQPRALDLAKLSANELEVYKHLEAYITDLISLKIKGGSVFMAEVRIADPTKNLAGTVDLIEVLPNGQINIYDYKTRSKENLNKIKLDEYSQQLKSYSDILESVLNTDVLQRRIVPIKISRKSDGSLNVDIKSQEPVALEKTGLEELDILLDKLQSRLDFLESQTVPEKQRLAHKDKIEKTQKSIKSIQMQKDLTSTIEIALDEIEIIVNDLKNGTFDLNTNLKEAHDLLKLYKEFDNFIPDNFLDKETQAQVAVLISQARLAERNLRKAEEQYLVANGEKYGIIGTEATKNKRDFLSPVKELGRWDRWVQGPSFSEHPIIQTLRRAVEGTVLKIRDRFTTIRDEVKVKQKAMFDHLGETTFEPLLQTYKDGKRTGKLVDKVSPEYWMEAGKAKTAGDLAWFQNNSDFDSARYTKELNNYRNFVNKSTKLKDEQKTSLVNKWIKENQANWYKFHTAKATWFDQKWIDLTSGKYKGTPVEEFYNYYKTTMNELIDGLPLESVYETFIPNIKSGFLERSANVGFSNTLRSGFDFSSLEVLHDDPKYGKFDSDNNPIDNIPILFTDTLNPNEKSYDLGLLLTAFAGTSLNYKNLVELEGLKEASLSFVRNQEEYITNSKNEIGQKKSGLDLKRKPEDSLSSHYGQLKDYVDVVFYGRRRTNEKTKTFKNKYIDRVTAWAKGEETVTEREYAWSKLFDGVLQFTAIKALGFNFFAPVTNYLSAESTSFMTGFNGLYFDAKDKTTALSLLGANDEKAKLMIDKFKVKMGDFQLDELSVLSTDKIKMGITDMAFAGYHLGDYAVQNSNFIAMLLSNKHEIKWDDYEVVDGRLKKKGSPEIELDVIRFRNKVMKVNKKIMGNMDPNDYAAIKRYMLGRALMQFRNWLPAMFEERWGRARFDYDLEMWTEGRYRTGYKYIIDHVLNPMLGDTKSKLLAWKSLTPQQRAAMKSNLLDMAIIIGVLGLLGMLRGDGDDDKSMMDRYSIRVIDRTLAELTFFSIPVVSSMWADKYQIIISPAAAVSTLEDIGRVFTHISRKIEGEENADPARAIKRMAPIINQVTKLDEILAGKVQY
jgi:RecB family exonuclease